MQASSLISTTVKIRDRKNWKLSANRVAEKPVSSKGSEGPDKKMASMLDFFDEIHDKLDFSGVSKDINDLRDKIAS